MLPRTLRNTYIASAILVLAVMLYVGFLYGIRVKEEAVRSYMTARVSASERQLQISSLSKVVNESEKSRSELLRALIGEDGVTEFLELIESTARQEGLEATTRSVALEPAGGGEAFESLVLVIEVEGSYGRVARMLALLETLPYQVVFSGVTLDRVSSIEDDIWKGVFSFRVTKAKSL